MSDIIRPIEPFQLTQGFGGNYETYKVIKYLSYFDFLTPIVAPVFGKLTLGILKTLTILSLIKPMQSIKSASSPFLLKVQTPLAFLTNLPRLLLRLYNSQTFKSILSSPQKKSKGVFKALCGLLSPNFLINHSSQAIPFGRLSKPILSLSFKWRIFHNRLIHKVEQYFRLLGGTSDLQRIHNIRIY